MKALVLCGGLPQIALIKELKKRGIKTLLADMNEKVGARQYADEFYKISVLDVDAVRTLAKEKKVDFVITVCADQVLQVMAQVSEDLGLPCYIDFKTAEKVSKKSFMKKVFAENEIPTSKFVILDELDEQKIKGLEFPLIVKPVDAYSSRGVCKVSCVKELETAFQKAKKISRAGDVIVEEFVEGDEITVDIYVEDGKANVLCLSKLDKIGEDGKFVINRSHIPAVLSEEKKEQIALAAQKIADAFNLKNSPMLIQLISNDEKISVVEFCARTGGGIKFLMIKKHSGFDVVKAVVDLTLGEKPHYEKADIKTTFTVNEFIYCNSGVFDRLEGFEELLNEGIITEYSQFKAQGAEFSTINGSGDRVAYFSIEAETFEEVAKRHRQANQRIRALSNDGRDLIRHELIAKFN